MSYRMIDTAMWNDPCVRSCSLQARGLLGWLMMGPARTALPGLVAIGPAGLAEALSVTPKQLGEALDELASKGLVEVDVAAPLVRVVDGVRWDGAPNAKIVRAWKRLLSDLPPSRLVTRHRASMKAAAAETCPPEVVSEVFGESEPTESNDSAHVDTPSLPFPNPIDTPSEVVPRARASSVSSSASSSASTTASAAIADEGVLAVFSHWTSKLWSRFHDTPPKLTAKRRKKIEQRLREGFSVEQLCGAIDAVTRSDFHMGKNDDGKPWIEIDLIFRDTEKVDGWLAKRVAPQKTNGRAAPQQANANAVQAVLAIRAATGSPGAAQ